jgi:hypothetical protein
MFRSTTIIRELVQSLAKVMLEHSVRLCPYRLCGGVAACLGVASVLCAVRNETELGETSYELPHIFCEYREPFLVVKRFTYI